VSVLAIFANYRIAVSGKSFNSIRPNQRFCCGFRR
jgi:hypothetical protein